MAQSFLHIFFSTSESSQDPNVPQSASSGMARNTAILCALLSYYTQLANRTAINWTILLLLLSNVVPNFCDNKDIAIKYPRAFTVLRGIPSLSISILLVTEVIRISDNAGVTVFQLLVVIIATVCSLFWQKIEAFACQSFEQTGRSVEEQV
ncbi:hypothetical protein D9758_012607 [Tetrapyrgos nigripes]|uniref:Uncharacterized protein n=1 Tax=Tetrapyrgos nigripes TaxID=182062 RepID=A0A8H5GE16_9AGAR|nr:hypothetical protein D9758_012607 [Tetrapyrgos nigripes]